MARLIVPYAEKDQAKALGARWDAAGKTWYVPEGMMLEPFECWLPDGMPGGMTVKEALKRPAKSASKPGKANRHGKPVKPAKARVDAYTGKTVVGARYFKHDHDCSPFDDCAVCRPVLEASGWADARRSALDAAAHGRA
jgi:hypothetical protein